MHTLTSQLHNHTMTRKLGPHETYAAVRSKMKSYSNVFVAARLHQAASEAAVRFCVQKLIENEPILATAITGQEGTFEVYKHKEVVLDDYVDFSYSDVSLPEAHSDLHYVLFDLSKSHWKVYLLDHGMELLFLYDHTLLDGMSGSFAIGQLVHYLRDFSEIKNAEDYTEPENVKTSSKDIPPPVEAQITVSAPISRLFTELTNEYLFSKPENSLPRQKLPWKGFYEIVDFSQSETANFLNMCKENNISGGAGLYALMVTSPARILHGKYPDSVTKPASGSVPINARNFCQGDPKRLGMVVGEVFIDSAVPEPSMLEFDGKTPSKAFFEVAKAYSECLARDTTATWFSGYPFMHIIGLIPYVSSLTEFFKKHTDNYNRNTMFSLSNLTAVDMDVQRLRFSQCTGGTCPFIQFSSVGVKNGPISVSIAVAEDDSVAGEVKRSVLEFLEKLA